MRRIIVGIVVSFAATSCAASGVAPPQPRPEALQVRPTDTPLVLVSDGAVTALVPGGWRAAAVSMDASRGFVASPHPERWRSPAALETGLAATWIDATRVGLPSDVYYLAATGPMFDRLVDAPGCTAERRVVFADNAPGFARGGAASPGDFVARGSGVCAGAGAPARRWCYFVAAPGFGPAKQLGIPSSGLYVAVAVTRDAPGAGRRLADLLRHVSFGGASVQDFVRAVRSPAVGL
ncbi:MAG: hypothetical protein ACM3OO_08905 [Planctomycetaceae bacterium]